MRALIKARAIVEVEEKPVKRTRWDVDGTDEVSSMSVHIGLLSEEENYARWKRENPSGSIKTVICTEISALMVSSGVKVVLLAKDIHMKINAVEYLSRKASDWLSNTGQGVTCKGSIRTALLIHCQYYYKLQDVMLLRAGTRPLLTNYADNGSNNESRLGWQFLLKQRMRKLNGMWLGLWLHTLVIVTTMKSKCPSVQT